MQVLSKTILFEVFIGRDLSKMNRFWNKTVTIDCPLVDMSYFTNRSCEENNNQNKKHMLLILGTVKIKINYYKINVNTH